MIRGVRQIFALFLALLAIMAQLTLAAAVPASTVSLADVTVLCHHDGDSNAPPAPAHQSSDCLLCLVCHGAAGPVGLLTDPPRLPAPATTHVARAAVLPPVTAPPLRTSLAARPRGPPLPV